MKLFNPLKLILLSGFLLFLGCHSESENAKEKVVLGKVELLDAWARPGTKGQTSSIYLTIVNGTASQETLVGVQSNAAAKTEIHESIQNDDGTMSMRPAGKQSIEDGSKLRFQPGGLHIMLMKLKRDLAIGDSVSLTLDFAHVGTKKIAVPVQIQH